jgi:DHA3 family macrolide efflux protein-like MFS transporter
VAFVPPGMAAFRWVWFGQFVSIFGSGLTTFALAIWVWQETGQATALALIPVFGWLPGIIFGPIAGALVDRWKRKRVLILSDFGSSLAVFALFVLYQFGSLEIWHLYAATAVASLFNAFQWPAFSAAITLMVRKEEYSRASGMLSLAESASFILSPLAGAALVAFLSLGQILLIDAVTFLIALVTLILVRIPEPAKDPVEQVSPVSVWKDSLTGFQYIWRQKSLLGIQVLLFSYNFVKSFGFAVLPAMILARTAENAAVLGTVQAAAAAGGVVGGLILSVWPGPRRQIHGVLLGTILASLFTQLLFGLGREVFLWSAFAFIGTIFRPWINAANQAIWQRKVAPHLQGRVFGARATIALISLPLGYLFAGPLADYVFEPAMMPGGAWAETFVPLVGTGPGAGMALMIVLSGVVTVAIGVLGYFMRSVREVEALLPDHEPKEAAAAR